MIKTIKKNLDEIIKTNPHLCPNTIRMNKTGMNKLREDFGYKKIPGEFKTILGLNVIVDDSLPENVAYMYNNLGNVKINFNNSKENNSFGDFQVEEGGYIKSKVFSEYFNTNMAICEPNELHLLEEAIKRARELMK